MNTVKIRNIKIGTQKPKVCVPIVEITKENILLAANNLMNLKWDIVEWRIDFYQDCFDYLKVIEVLKELRNIFNNKVILVTFRTQKEGGNKTISEEEYLNLYENIALSKLADIIDVEVFNDFNTVKLIDTIHQHGLKVIGSNHDFNETYSSQEIVERLLKMEAMNCDICKIAMMPLSFEDVLTLMWATSETKEKINVPIVTMSMGKIGMMSRLLGEVTGSCITFGAANKTSAPGQINVEELNIVLDIIHENQ